MSYGCVDERVVYLVGLHARFYQYGAQPVLRDGQDRGYVRVGGYYHLVALMQYAHGHVRPEDKGKRVKSIATPYAVGRTYVLGVSLLEGSRGLSPQVAATCHHAGHGLLYLSIVHGGGSL